MFEAIAKSLLPASVQSFLRTRKLQRTLSHFSPRVVSRTFGGLPLKVQLRDPIAEEWYDRDWPESAELAFLKRTSLKPGARVFDLGAHQGVVALTLAAVVGESGQVIALEANPHNAAVARENVALNAASNLVIVHAACAATNGRLTFNLSLNGQVDGGDGTHGRIEVESRSVDDLAQEYGQPDLIFVDVEGFECEVLRGAERSLLDGADCFVEVHGGAGLEKFGGSVEKLLAFFPTDRFDRFYSLTDKGPFLALEETAGLEGKRWFFIAVQKH